MTILLLLALTAMLGAAQSVEEVMTALGEGRHKDALARLQPLLKSSPSSPQLLTLKGIALGGTGQPDTALECFRAALKVRPDYLPALQGAAEIEYNAGKPEALTRLERLVTLSSENPTAHAMLGVLYFEQGRFADAVQHFERGRASLGRNPSALWQYAQALYQLNRFAEAGAAYGQLVAATPGRPEPRFNLALSRFAEGRFADTLTVLDPLLQAPKPDLSVLRLAASANESRKNTAEAIALLRRAVTMYPREEHVYLDLANLCLDHSSFDLGIEIIEAAMKNVKPTARLHTMRGILYIQSGRPELAEADFEAARQLSPDAAFGQVGLSITMMESDRLDESIRLLRQQLEGKPGDPSVVFVLAQALLKKGREPGTPEYAEAESALEKLIHQNPNHGPAQALLGKIYLSREEPEKAIRLLERALALEPSDRTAAYQLMLAYSRTGQRDKSSAMSSRVRELLQQEREEEVERNRIRLIKAPERLEK